MMQPSYTGWCIELRGQSMWPKSTKIWSIMGRPITRVVCTQWSRRLDQSRRENQDWQFHYSKIREKSAEQSAANESKRK
jgi:hypothetical protein